MKKIFACMICSSLLVAMTGCAQKEEPITAMDLMSAVNDKNILHTDPLARIWYEVDPMTFADSDGDGIGDLSGIISYIDYLSDGDELTHDADLNMNGIYIKNVIQEDAAGRLVDFSLVNPTLGSMENLRQICVQAALANMVVMIDFDLDALSTESQPFIDLKNAADKLEEGQGIDDLDPKLTEMFTLSEEETEGNWRKLGKSDIYYLSMGNDDSANVNQDSAQFKELVKKAVKTYIDLGVGGFYVHDIDKLYTNDDEKNVEFINWFYKLVMDMKSDATVVVDVAAYDESMKSVQASFFDPAYSGAEGYIAKGVTNTMSAMELGEAIEKQENHSRQQAVFLNNDGNTLDLLKNANRLPQLKMAMALHILMSGQVFIGAGDEIGMPTNQVAIITQGFIKPEESGQASVQDQSGQSVDLVFGSLEEQNQDGNSILNFIRQAILLRDSYAAISSGTMAVLKDLTTDSILALQKDTEGSSVILVFNLSGEDQKVSTKGVQILGLPCELGGILLSSPSELTFENDQLILPPYSVALLK